LKKIIISVSNDIVTDQRVIRIAGTLSRNGYDLLIVGRNLPQSPDHKDFQYPIHLFSMWFKRGPLFYLFLNLRLFFFLLFTRTDILLANDLDTLPANYWMSKIKNIPLVYDSHEYFTEVPELTERKSIQKIWLNIESHIIPKLKYFYTVNQSIAGIYQEKYNTEVKVIRNLPDCRNGTDQKSDIPGVNGRKMIIYQGALNMARGIDLAIQSMAYLEDAVLVIAGDGPERKELEKHAHLLDVNDKVIFLGRKLPDELSTITGQAGLGISFEQKQGLNYYYALPNKLFDYIHAEIPVLVSPFPEMKAVVKKYEIGEILESFDPENIAVQINRMLKDEKKREYWMKNLKDAANELCWRVEEKKLIEIFESIE